MSIYTEAADYIRERIPDFPSIGILTGTGLGFSGFSEEGYRLPYRGVPHFPGVSSEGHEGSLIIARMAGQPVALFSGRLHYYEGHSIQACGFPVHLMSALGVTDLIMSNVSGSVNSEIRKGDIVLLRDHINLMGVNPLRGLRNEEGYVSFPQMVNAYRVDRHGAILEAASAGAIHEGVYAAFAGPSLETRQEYKMAQILGADVVGMSTVPEIIVASAHSIHCNVISLVSNECFGEHVEPTTIESVLQVASENKSRVYSLVERIIDQIMSEKQ